MRTLSSASPLGTPGVAIPCLWPGFRGPGAEHGRPAPPVRSRRQTGVVNSKRDNGRRVRWNHAVIGWSGGDHYQLDVPHYIDGWPIAWLERNVEDRVRAVPGCEEWLVAVTEATP